jgi:hypothetical protein
MAVSGSILARTKVIDLGMNDLTVRPVFFDSL